jgi:hypothetical protein
VLDGAVAGFDDAGPAMNTYLAEIIATERIAELRREADARRLVADARRHRRIEHVLRPPLTRWSFLRTVAGLRRRTA